MREITFPRAAAHTSSRTQRLPVEPLVLRSPRHIFSDDNLAIIEHSAGRSERLLSVRAVRPMSSMCLDDHTLSIVESSLDGGGAKASEAIAFKTLQGALKAELIGNESEVKYKCKSSVADMVIRIGNDKVGVSVTRAFDYQANPLTWDRTCSLLESKLSGLSQAWVRTVSDWEWDQNLIFVWVACKSHMELILEAWDTIAPTSSTEVSSLEQLRGMPNLRLRAYIESHHLKHSDCDCRVKLLARASEVEGPNGSCPKPTLIVCHAIDMPWIF